MNPAADEECRERHRPPAGRRERRGERGHHRPAPAPPRSRGYLPLAQGPRSPVGTQSAPRWRGRSGASTRRAPAPSGTPRGRLPGSATGAPGSPAGRPPEPDLEPARVLEDQAGQAAGQRRPQAGERRLRRWPGRGRELDERAEPVGLVGDPQDRGPPVVGRRRRAAHADAQASIADAELLLAQERRPGRREPRTGIGRHGLSRASPSRCPGVVAGVAGAGVTRPWSLDASAVGPPLARPRRQAPPAPPPRAAWPRSRRRSRRAPGGASRAGRPRTAARPCRRTPRRGSLSPPSQDTSLPGALTPLDAGYGAGVDLPSRRGRRHRRRHAATRRRTGTSSASTGTLAEHHGQVAVSPLRLASSLGSLSPLSATPTRSWRAAWTRCRTRLD